MYLDFYVPYLESHWDSVFVLPGSLSFQIIQLKPINRADNRKQYCYCWFNHRALEALLTVDTLMMSNVCNLVESHGVVEEVIH